MPYVPFDPQDPNNQQQGQGVNNPNQVPNTTLAGGSGTIGADINNPNSKQPNSSGSFTNISQYIQKNAPGAAQLADNVAGSFTNKGDEALNTAQTQFNGLVDQNTVTYNPDLVSQAAQDPANFVQDPSKVDLFNIQRDAEYKGPESFEAANDIYSTLTNSLNNVKTQADLTNTEAGRKTLLQDYNSSNGFNRASNGNLSLDNLLLQNDPSSRDTFENARNTVAGLDERLAQAAQAANQKAQQAKTETENTKNQVADYFNNAETGVIPTFKTGLENKTQVEKDLIANLQNAFNRDSNYALQKGSNLSAEQVKALGLTPEQYANISALQDQAYNAYYNNPFGYNYLTKPELGNQATFNARMAGTEANPINGPYNRLLEAYNQLNDVTEGGLTQKNTNLITPQTTASADDYAKYQALQQLMGNQQDFYLADPSQANTTNPNLSKYSYDTLTSRLQSIINNLNAPRNW